LEKIEYAYSYMSYDSRDCDGQSIYND